MDIIKAMQESGWLKEKQRIENEVQNGGIDPNHKDVIKIIIQNMYNWFGKTKADDASESWDVFLTKMRKKEMKVDDFLVDFETSCSRLVNVIPNIPKIVFALQLLRAVNVDEAQRRSIISNIKFDVKNDNVYEELKSSIRLLKGSLVEKSNTTEENEAFYGQNKKFYQNRGQFNNGSGFRGREERSSQSFKGYNVQGRDKSRSKSRERSRESSRSRNERNNKILRDKAYYSQEEDIRICYRESSQRTEEVLVNVTEEGNRIVLDCGTTKTVGGILAVNTLLESLDEKQMKKVKEYKDERGDEIWKDWNLMLILQMMKLLLV